MAGSGQKSTLGIIAGRGRLPAEIARAATGNGRDIFVLALQGQAEEPVIAPFPHEWVRIGDVSRALTILRNHSVRELVLAGAVTRPSLRSIRPDARGARFIAKAGLRALGDDSLLTAIIKELEIEGFHVVGAEEIWREALMPSGNLTSTIPSEDAWRDITRGVAVSQALGRADVGQSVVVQQGIVLAVEAIEGTDAMLTRAGTLRREGPGGVLVKLAKPGQDMRVDRPAVGLQTVRAAITVGLSGIAVEAGAALLLDREQAIARANEAGLFVHGIDPRRLPIDPESTATAPTTNAG